MDQLEKWPLERLIEYARNPRKNDHAVDKVASAIREFGFRVPVLAKSDGSLVDGHLRLKAARKLGMSEVPVLLCDDMTDAQIKAFRLSVNRVAEEAGWDDELLRIELDELGELGFDIELTGFSLDEIADLELGGGEGDEEAQDGEEPVLSENYSRKIEAPIYEPTGDCPHVNELYDADRTKQLEKELEGLDALPEVKGFLLAAAQRHTRFRYDRIAEYYAHASPEVQRLMENSALVIVDYEKAIELGFVSLSERLMEVAGEEVESGQ